MKIIELRAENIKRLKAVDITPDGTLQVVAGRNAQGKSSVLDAIWLALGGGKAGKETTRPIRDGEEKASVTLDMGELVVTRTWTTAGTKLQVQSADGATHKSPQGMLDALVGQLSFDPLAFTRLSAREQRDSLLDLVELDVDIDQLDAERQQAYDQRTQVGRDGKAIGDVSVDDSLPEDEQSASELIARIREAQEVEYNNGSERENLESMKRSHLDLYEQIQRLQAEWKELGDSIDKQEELVAHLPQPADTAELEQQLSTVEETNAAIRTNNQAKEQQAQKDQLRTQYEGLTQSIDDLDKRKADALAAAEFPVEGLAFDEHGVTYQGVPFSQASSAEQIKVSLAMAMALNPKLRVLRIMDGSLLDDESIQVIAEQLKEHDFQLFLEKVGDADQGAVIIEDGEVVE